MSAKSEGSELGSAEAQTQIAELLAMRRPLPLDPRPEFAEMQRAGRAATAVCLLNAENISKYAGDVGGWEFFDVGGFSDGVTEMAQMVVSKFNDALRRAVEVGEPEDLYRLEEVLRGLAFCINQQATIMGGRPPCESAFVQAHMAGDRLEAAFDKLWEVVVRSKPDSAAAA